MIPAFIRLVAVLLGLAAFVPAQAAAQTVGTRVTNTATLSFGAPDERRTVTSNTVSLDVAIVKRPTTLGFRLLPVGYVLSGMRCETVPALRFTPAPLDAATLAKAPVLERLDTHTPLIIVLDASGANRNPAVRETAVIDVTTESFTGRLPLLETGADTGVFAGGVPQPGTHPELVACDPAMTPGTHLRLSYAEDEYSYGSSYSKLIDPAGHVFDSASGALVDGAEVTLLDADGRPATVFGDDGVTRYPPTVISGARVRDASGRLYDHDPGYYRFPLVAPGRYHLRIVPPANFIAPSTRDRAYLATLRHPRGSPYLINDTSFGAPFDVVDDPFFADIPLDRVGEARLLLTKTASVREAAPGDFVQYRVTLANRGEAIVRNVHLNDILPRGLRYERGSERGVSAPEISRDGRTIGFAIPQIAPSATVEVRYVVSVTPDAPVGEAVNRVLASGGDGATSNEAAASVRVRAMLFTDGFTIVGRVTAGACGDPLRGRDGVAGVRLLLEDGTFVVTDRDGLYHLEGIRPGRHVVQLDRATLPAGYEAVACDADTRQAGSAISRFVESEGGLLKRVDFQLRRTGAAIAATAALPIAVADDATAAGGTRDWFAGQAPGVAWLFPEANHNPRAPALRVAIKHLPGQRVALTVNGRPSEPIAFDAPDTNPTGTIAVSRWTGIPLGDGDNRLEARILSADGRVVETLVRVVHSAGTADRVILVAEKSRLGADGITRPLVAVRVTDRTGHPVRAGTLLPFTVDQPYAAAIEAELEQERARAGQAHTARVVGDDGLAFIALQPTTQAGSVRITTTLADGANVRTGEIRAWLSATARDWTVVGFGAGTLGYDVLNKRGTSLSRRDRGGVVTDGQLALYAKGRIKGEWLATIAYDSDRTRDRDRGLLGTIDPDRYYTVYGDGTRQGYDAATGRKLYLRLERRDAYALLGDFETGLSETQLGRYSRTLNGVKLAYGGNVVSVTAFGARTDELYGRDEIQGNGLSGPYRLSGRDIVPNSDKLRLETRDRFRPERIVSTTQMTRHLDYDIDTAAGTIRFREPVLSRDNALNPVFIVVDYETYGRGAKKVAGARGALRLAGGRVEMGATFLHDETIGRADVAAVDLKARPTDATEIRAEAGMGGRRGLGNGRAWLVEAEHHDGAIDVLGYARQQDGAFGLGQQNLVEANTRRIGMDGRVRLDDLLSITATGWHQDQLDGPGQRDALDARLELRRPGGTVFGGVQLAMDRGLDGGDRDSRLLTLGGTQALAGGKLTLSGQTQVAPGGDKDSVDFPIRHQLNAAWRVAPTARLLGGYEIADGKDFAARTARVGFDVAPWTGAKLMSTLNQQVAGTGENAQRTYAQYGLNQSLPINANWTIDATLDASSTMRGRLPAGAVVNAFQPIASGGSLAQDGTNGDFTAVTLGAGYRGGRWSWNGRVEYRASNQGDRFGITTNILQTLGGGRTMAGSLRWYQVTQDDGAIASSGVADLSVAWRPLDGAWSLLERMSLRRDRADAGFTGANVLGVPAYGGDFQATLRAVNNIALNYRSGAEGGGHGIEATVYHGLKWVRGSYGADDHAGFTDVIGFDIRQDLGRRFDAGVQGSVRHGWSSGTIAFAGGPTVGVSPAVNLWLTAGYNVAGYRDRDFEEDRYTRQGPFVTMRLKFDQGSIARAGRALWGMRP